MAGRKKLRPIINNNKAISEEFTSLPALSVVMIGFTLFLVLMANTYNAYETRVESLEKYKTAEFIATKLTNPDCFFIKEGGILNIESLETAESKQKLNTLRDEYKTSGFDFIIRINWDTDLQDFPESLPSYVEDRVAVSKEIGICLNEAQTKPGTLTVILWSVF